MSTVSFLGIDDVLTSMLILTHSRAPKWELNDCVVLRVVLHIETTLKTNDCAFIRLQGVSFGPSTKYEKVLQAVAVQPQLYNL